MAQSTTILSPSRRRPLGEAALDEFDVAAAGVVEPLGAAELARRGARSLAAVLELRLDLRLDLVGELVAVGAEQLDAVVLEGIVRGRDHRRRDRRAAMRVSMAIAGVGSGPDQHHVHAHRDEAGGQRRLEHVAGEPRVLADDDEMAMVAAPQAPAPAAIATLSAVSGVIGSLLAVPRMPSVPKSLRVIASLDADPCRLRSYNAKSVADCQQPINRGSRPANAAKPRRKGGASAVRG